MRKVNFNKKSFSILIVVFAMITGLVIQSCQTEDVYFIEPEKKSALDNFENLMTKTVNKSKIQRVVLKRDKLINAKSTSSKQELQNLEIETQKALQPLLDKSINLLHSYEFTDEEIIKEFGSLDSPKVLLAGMFILSIEKDKQKHHSMASNLTLQKLISINVANAEEPDPTVRACLATAVGIAGIYDLVKNTASLGTVQTTVRALKLIGRRYLGWVGVALMIYDFTDCYYGLTS